MFFKVLGPLAIETEDGANLRLERPAHRRLVSLLLLESGRRVSTDRLIDRFWEGEEPATAKTALQTHISAARRVLPEGTIVTEGYGYSLPLHAHRTDERCFVEAVREARDALGEGRWGMARDQADSALSLWRGRPYEELGGDFVVPTSSRLGELRLEALEIRAESLVRSGHADEVVAELEGLVAEHPVRERLWAQLVVARHQLGRHADAVRAFREVEEIFAARGLELGPELRDLEGQVLRHDPAVSVGQGQHNLPTMLTTFVGRREERREVASLLREHRLVTLTGVGGTGKTRLAVQVTADLLSEQRDGCWLTELAPIADGSMVASAVAASLSLHPHGGSELEQLGTALAGRRTLLVIDNCEHVSDAAAAVVHAVLSAASDVTVLATSRQRLGVPGEVVYDLAPLALPPRSTDANVEQIRQSDAVRLLEDRARLVRPGFELTAADLPVVATLCRRLDGVPLAIELAAARLRTLELTVINDRLDDRFRLLTGGGSTTAPRHRTLDAALRWSHDLLSPEEQRVFAKLAVFRGSFDLDAAEAVCADESIAAAAVVPVVAELVDKSLVATTETVAGRRYRLLEMVRDFAAAEPSDEEARATRDRHAAFFADLADTLAQQLRTADQSTALDHLRADLDNVRAALAHAHDSGDRHLLLRLVAALMAPFVHAGLFGDAWYWLRLVPSDDSSLPAHRRARLLIEGVEAAVASEPGRALDIGRRAVEAATEAHGRPDLVVEARAERMFAQVTSGGYDPSDAGEPGMLEDAEACGDDWVLGRVKDRLGLRLVYMYDAGSTSLLEEAIAHFRAAGDLSRQAMVTWHRAFAAQRLGRYAEAEEWSARGVELARSCGNLMVEVHADSVRGDALSVQRDPRALEAVRRSVRGFAEIGDQWCLTLQLVRLGLLELEVDPDAARGHICGAIERAIRLDMPALHIADAADLAASLLTDRGRLEVAVALWAAADAVRPAPEVGSSERTAPGPHLVAELRAPREASVHATLGPARVAHATTESSSWSRRDLEAIVREELDVRWR